MRNNKTNWPYINLRAIQFYSNISTEAFYEEQLSFDIADANFIPNFQNIIKKIENFLQNCMTKRYKLILCQSNIEGIADDLQIVSSKYDVKIMAEYPENILYKQQLKNINFNKMLRGVSGD